MRTRSTKYVLLAPAVLVVLATTTYPLATALVTSFREYNLARSFDPGPFVGLENYRRAVEDDFFWESVVVTIQYTVIAVALTLVLAMAMALLLQRPGKLATVAKTMLILPFAVAPALKGFSWRFMLNPDFGVYDALIDTAFPFAEEIIWLSNHFWALFWLAMSEVWGWAPLIALMFIGALVAIPKDVVEAARMDGASSWELFRHVTLPLIAPVIVIATLLKIIWSLKMFDQVVTMTGGGPGRSTQTLNFYVYRTGMNFLDLGYASALAWILVVALGIFAVLYVRLLMRQATS